MAQSKYWSIEGAIIPEDKSAIEFIGQDKGDVIYVVMKQKGSRATTVKKLFQATAVTKESESEILSKSPVLHVLYGTYESSRKRKIETESTNRSKRIKQEVEVAKNLSDDEYYEQCYEDGDGLMDYKIVIQQRNHKRQVEIRRHLREEAKSVTWKKWQQQVIDIIEQQPDTRKVHVILDPKGGVGKSFLVRNYGLLHRDKVLEVAASKKADMLYLASLKTGYDTVFIDLCREDVEGEFSYSAVEAIKNGVFCSTKYECKSVYTGPVHVVIFTNKDLDYSKLSMDRWNVLCIDENESVSVKDVSIHVE